jgi:hypothetical protein
MKPLIVLTLLAILVSLGKALFSMSSGPEHSARGEGLELANRTVGRAVRVAIHELLLRLDCAARGAVMRALAGRGFPQYRNGRETLPRRYARTP